MKTKYVQPREKASCRGCSSFERTSSCLSRLASGTEELQIRRIIREAIGTQGTRAGLPGLPLINAMRSALLQELAARLNGLKRNKTSLQVSVRKLAARPAVLSFTQLRFCLWL